MIDSLTIFSKGGLVLFQYETKSSIGAQIGDSKELLNEFISSSLLNPTRIGQSQRAMCKNSVVAEWEKSDEWMAVALYPEVVLRGGTNWIRHLLQSALREYALFYKIKTQDQNKDPAEMMIIIAPETTDFEPTFEAILRQAENIRETEPATSTVEQEESSSSTSAATNEDLVTQRQKFKKKGKEMTVWHGMTGKVTKETLAKYDRSKDAGVDGIEAAVAEDSRALAEARAAYLPSTEDMPSWEDDETLDDSEKTTSSSGTWGSSLKGLFDQMSGNKVLTNEDLDAPLTDMQRMLTSKNVANEIAKEMCDKVRAKLVGKKMQSFSRVKTAVRQALESSIQKILQPTRNVDILRGAITKRERGTGVFRREANPDPFVIVMVGINGVGKSTSLAKIAYYLKSNGCNPILAACDTFRSGAVEQLNVHAKCLEVPLYHQGYAKDPSAVAKAAIAHAKEEKHDVVLVDTAGRMQNNVPLMKALSKLVVENSPDLVLFVCEALVGNDGMDQLSMFNKALRSGGHVRQIDGIVLTKYDTVSDKVGAALTMTHLTGAPVVFVGTGQKYNHLKKLSTSGVIKSLFS